MRIIYLIILLIITILGISFAILNSQTVTLNYFFGEQQLPLSLLLIITLALGTIIGLGYAFCVYLKYKHQNNRLRSQLKSIERKVRTQLQSESI